MADNPREEKPIQPVSSTETKDEETRLIEAAQNGDKRAFGQLVRRHQKRLFRFIYGLTGSFDVTEDIVQEAFIKAHGALERFRTGFAFYPWLATIARNLAYNHIAREEKQDSLNGLSEKGFDPAQTDPGPLDKLLDQEGQKRFYQALKKMPAKYRSVFVLRHFEDMDYAAIASYLKIPPGTVDSRLYRARQYLLEELKDLLPDSQADR
ncbi:MAG TPA: sigma-70 family RNA polymerase sigma factor [candidate division Zixibacteria bacterium]|nr:sigma-70 family RNA polymerase sigma factor [candidate division Zixibacteria bacterium]